MMVQNVRKIKIFSSCALDKYINRQTENNYTGIEILTLGNLRAFQVRVR